MLLDFFTKLGLFQLNGDKPIGRRIYDGIVGALNEQLSTEPGTLGDNFAAALALAAADATVQAERAFEQQLPDHVYELLPQKEQEYGLFPNPSDSITVRRQALAARMLLPNGMTRINVENILKSLLGDQFVGYRVTHPDERVMFPAALGDAPQNLVSPNVSRILMRFNSAISTQLGVPQYVVYTQLAPSEDTPSLKVGDRLVVEPELKARTEVVTIVESFKSGDDWVLMAAFSQAHEKNCYATTMPFPVWASSQRESLVVVKPAVVKDAEVRRKIAETLERVFRGVSTWGIAQEGSTPHTTEGIILDDGTFGQLDINTLGAGDVPLP